MLPHTSSHQPSPFSQTLFFFFRRREMKLGMTPKNISLFFLFFCGCCMGAIWWLLGHLGKRRCKTVGNERRGEGEQSCASSQALNDDTMCATAACLAGGNCARTRLATRVTWGTSQRRLYATYRAAAVGVQVLQRSAVAGTRLHNPVSLRSSTQPVTPSPCPLLHPLH